MRAAAPGSGRHAARITEELLSSALQRKFLLYDKSGEEHYNLISALHKSVRNSDADAALYWLARMLESGEDPLYIARRLVRMASEDIGLADPAALGIAVAAMQAADFVGMPEGNLALAQAAVYLGAGAEIQRALHRLRRRCSSDLQKTAAEPVPLHLRNAVTGLMKHEGYGKGYQYAHDEPEKVADMACLPPSLAGRDIISPPTRDSSSACASAWKRSAGSNPAKRQSSRTKTASIATTTSATTSPNNKRDSSLRSE